MPYTITASCTGCQACTRVCPADAIRGEKTSLHTILADLCIECGACGRICPHAAVLDREGRPCVMLRRSQWPAPRFDDSLCMSCLVCVETCPANCLGMSGPLDSFQPHGFPFLKDEKACIGCGFCAQECPVGAVTMVSPEKV